MAVWLTSTDSLTRRLTRLGHGQFRVEVISQSQQMFFDPVYRRRMQHWCRRVMLYGDEPLAWVEAETRIAMPQLRGPLRQVTRLRQRALGHLLFGRVKPVTRRSVCINQGQWQRVSHYVWRGQRLQVTETFLPAFEARVCRQVRP